jgi:hypothetical protein
MWRTDATRRLRCVLSVRQRGRRWGVVRRLPSPGNWTAERVTIDIRNSQSQGEAVGLSYSDSQGEKGNCQDPDHTLGFGGVERWGSVNQDLREFSSSGG